MADCIELNGVLTWYEKRGNGDPLLLLHPGGAGVDSRAWGPNIEALSSRFTAFTPDRRGHGRTPDVEGPITFEAMASDTVAFLETVIGEPAHLAGCSDGAVVALLVALRRPDLVRKLVFIAGVRLEHAVELYRSLADAELAVVPGTSHGLLVEKSALCRRLILDFLTTDPVPTIAPIRRAVTPPTSRPRAIVRVRAAMPASIVLPNIQFCGGPTGGIW